MWATIGLVASIGVVTIVCIVGVSIVGITKPVAINASRISCAMNATFWNTYSSFGAFPLTVVVVLVIVAGLALACVASFKM